MFVSNALIGLREGLEAALVVVILLAFLTKTDRTWGVRYVWLGVGTAIVLSVVLGAVLTFGTRQLSFEAQELIGGIASIVAVGFVTAMVFWMKWAARSISGELKGHLDRALDLGPLAVALVGFLGVGREGLETAVFFYATAQAAGAGNNLPLLGLARRFRGRGRPRLAHLPRARCASTSAASSAGPGSPSSSSPAASCPTASTTSRRPASCRA